ncbi:MAG: DUF126 domain-containing protein [Synergistales bacterium]|nr:DUF126 domain-containing protein [Synergistales bacterium]
MTVIRLQGRGAVGGVAEGPAMVSRAAIQGWSGVDDRTGLVIERGHPFEGRSIQGSVLVLSGGKGSNGWSCHFHAAKVAGIGPAAFVFPGMDSRTAVAAVVTWVPVVTDLEEDPFEIIRTGDRVRVDGDRGVVEILRSVDEAAGVEADR